MDDTIEEIEYIVLSLQIQSHGQIEDEKFNKIDTTSESLFYKVSK